MPRGFAPPLQGLELAFEFGIGGRGLEQQWVFETACGLRKAVNREGRAEFALERELWESSISSLTWSDFGSKYHRLGLPTEIVLPSVGAT